MAKQLYEFEFDEEELSEGWFNIDNLELCLFSEEHTLRELLTVREVKEPSDKDARIAELEKLLKKIQGHLTHDVDCISHINDEYCDCNYEDLLEELDKELSDET